jgi:excisionase family DNA binding protein
MGQGAMTEETRPGGITPIGNSMSGVKFFTVAEVAALMRVSKMSVYRLIHSGELESVRFGRSFRVTEAAVDAYLRGSYYQTG